MDVRAAVVAGGEAAGLHLDRLQLLRDSTSCQKVTQRLTQHINMPKMMDEYS